ncbi:acyl-CoA dehydrogenase [Xanthomonas cerealis pv. cerealis]|uniref:acyl-CoA dehydrogenase n=1 Tax=Xanthomonas translucens group TaxID=3390202 RepID=UPI000AAB6D28|nr:acyl-CoA dehydrogenase [Xanthomonas translucens]UKE68589.1 acyl-CoA dehydrogenase [Xanthomonas translucens pv. pistacia]
MTDLLSPTALGDACDLRRAALRVLERYPQLPLPGAGNTLDRWRILAEIAAADVCLAKVLEAHYDAQAILAELGAAAPPPGQLFAVWAAEAPDARLAYRSNAERGEVHGRKAWCSGAGMVDGALLTAHEEDRQQLVQVQLRQPAIVIDTQAWAAVGMARVVSGPVTFDAVPASAIGAPGQYLARPGFWHGGAGIAACWFGAAVAVAERLRAHPKLQRDAHAAMHLGAIDQQLGAARALLRELAAAIDAAPEHDHRHAVVRLRSFVERAASDVLDRVGRALGPAPLCSDREHALRCADLAVFVRQSHAEHDWAVLGQALAEQVQPWRL